MSDKNTRHIKRAAVIGHPIDHSLSPYLHGYWLKEHGIDGCYERIDVNPDEEGSLWRKIQQLSAVGYSGVNITIPFKQKAFDFFVQDSPHGKISERARICGSVNMITMGKTLENSENFTQNCAKNSFTAECTDIDGLELSLKEAIRKSCISNNTYRKTKDCDNTLDHVLLLGGGGTARAAVYALLNHGVRIITIAVRRPEQAYSIIDDFDKIRKKTHIRVLQMDNLEMNSINVHPLMSGEYQKKNDKNEWIKHFTDNDADVDSINTVAIDAIINTTPLGMVGRDDYHPSFLDWVKEQVTLRQHTMDDGIKKFIAIDAVYTNRRSSLLKSVQDGGGIALSGHWLLAFQAQPCFKKWFGETPVVNDHLIEKLSSYQNSEKTP